MKARLKNYPTSSEVEDSDAVINKELFSDSNIKTFPSR
jgi:hypothetical protein